MKQLLVEKQLVGKTIKRTVLLGGRHFIFFKDNTFCVFYESNLSILFLDKEFDRSATSYNGYVLYTVGLISKKEYDRLQNLTRKEAGKRYIDFEIEQLKELKLKYPNE